MSFYLFHHLPQCQIWFPPHWLETGLSETGWSSPGGTYDRTIPVSSTECLSQVSWVEPDTVCGGSHCCHGEVTVAPSTAYSHWNKSDSCSFIWSNFSSHGAILLEYLIVKQKLWTVLEVPGLCLRKKPNQKSWVRFLAHRRCCLFTAKTRRMSWRCASKDLKCKDSNTEFKA